MSLGRYLLFAVPIYLLVFIFIGLFVENQNLYSILLALGSGLMVIIGKKMIVNRLK
ncbi:hypothetical protein [Evansella cellulosilytica]|uniref:Uncharacterized protein n=1 Tax=Evansella cellulosilytica (strain ATCC 21833 / DSM 2522 / FERM P-1141 / JCM 9156 / N-4) TaxID=649639 RepID=E6TVQ5_EVAC2|nr:hypothetical protein [Evansella cellulosilytica]ADU32183.1 hypothetical protein Bcell_3949 [Evansella cellulosilytica DSM 2522]